jgi:prepilin-type N-terminal cleavage/methylation domain-containing protein
VKRNGFTLVELMIGITILVILMTIMVMTLNPGGILDKGNDARRKKDLERIKIAFEEYYNDKGCYPPAELIMQLMDSTNCNSQTIFDPWLKPWPCDPEGVPYYLSGDETASCSKWFKVLTNLANQQDKDIPNNWYNEGNVGVERWSAQQVNFGKSSTNINWYDGVMDAECREDICLVEVDRSGPVCNQSAGCNAARDGGCYLGVCKTKCLVPCCGDGCN